MWWVDVLQFALLAWAFILIGKLSALVTNVITELKNKVDL